LLGKRNGAGLSRRVLSPRLHLQPHESTTELVGTPEEISDESLISHLLANLSGTFKSVVDIITSRPLDDEKLDSISTQLIEYETSNALRKGQVGSNPNTAGTVAEGHALAAGVSPMTPAASISPGEEVETGVYAEKEAVTGASPTTRGR